jgi:hypothetical protein
LKQNNTIMFARLREFMPLAVSLALLTACSSNPFRSEQADGGKQGRIITVTSSLAGATVRANGNKLGETPPLVVCGTSVCLNYTVRMVNYRWIVFGLLLARSKFCLPGSV